MGSDEYVYSRVVCKVDILCQGKGLYKEKQIFH